MVDETPIGTAGVENHDSCSFPVQCAQPAQASIDLSFICPVSSSHSQVDLTEDRFISSQFVHTESQYSEDMFSDDSIERAAALIDEDQPANPATSIVSSYTEIHPDTIFSHPSEESALPSTVSEETFLTQPQGNSTFYFLGRTYCIFFPC
jgi:hypothetical protein